MSKYAKFGRKNRRYIHPQAFFDSNQRSPCFLILSSLLQHEP